MADRTNTAFGEIIKDDSPHVQELAWAVRDLVYDVLPNTTEVVWVKQGGAGWGTGPKKMSEHFSYFGAHSDHVDLGFFYGTELPDPKGLLEGTGKLLRHVKIRSLEDLQRPGVCALLEAAIKHRVPQPTNDKPVYIRK